MVSSNYIFATLISLFIFISSQFISLQFNFIIFSIFIVENYPFFRSFHIKTLVVILNSTGIFFVIISCQEDSQLSFFHFITQNFATKTEIQGFSSLNLGCDFFSQFILQDKALLNQLDLSSLHLLFLVLHFYRKTKWVTPCFIGNFLQNIAFFLILQILSHYSRIINHFMIFLALITAFCILFTNPSFSSSLFTTKCKVLSHQWNNLLDIQI